MDDAKSANKLYEEIQQAIRTCNLDAVIEALDTCTEKDYPDIARKVRHGDLEKGWIALREACIKNNPKDIRIVRALLDFKAEVDAHGPERRWTALMDAAESGFVEAVELLCRAKADITKKDHNHFTAMTWAVVANQVPSALKLMEMGDSVSIAIRSPEIFVNGVPTTLRLTEQLRDAVVERQVT